MKPRILFILCLLFPMCERSDINDKIYSKEGYIVGFDSCSYQHNYKTGFAIITSDLKDTLMTYNLTDSIYSFPPEYFNNYANTGYFPSNARYEFKIRFTYRIATKDEKVHYLCTSDINLSEFNNATQIIINTVSKIQ